MNNLMNLCTVCTKGFENQINIKITSGLVLEDEIKKIDMIKSKESISEKIDLKNYLFKRIEDLAILDEMGVLDLDSVNRFSSIITDECDVLSSFDIKDFEFAESCLNKFYDCRNNTYLLYALMYFNRIKRKYNLHFNDWVSVLRRIEVNSSNMSSITSALDDELLKIFIGFKNVSVDADAVEKTLVALQQNPALLTLVQYISYYTDVNLDRVVDLSNEQAKKISTILYNFFLTKVKKFENNDIAKVMEITIDYLLETNCNIKHISGFVRNVKESFFESNSKLLSYYNVACGDKYTDVVESCSKSYCEMLKFALLNRKFAFLDMVQANLTIFKEARENSLLNCVAIYETILNLNEIDKKAFEKLLTLPASSYKKCSVRDEDGKLVKLTPNEVIALANSKSNNIHLLYAKLDCKIDAKLLILRQLANVDYDFTSVDATMLAKRLSIANAKKRMENLPYNVDIDLMLNILSLDDKYQALIDEASNDIELAFIWRNRSNIDTNVPLKKNLDNFIENDIDCKKMFEIMSLSNDFINKHIDNIKLFCLKGNASIVCTYYERDDISSSRKTSMLYIAKAEMAGYWEAYKFHNISKEIEFELSDSELAGWKKNVTMRRDGFYGYETYSFNDTMLVGDKPSHTCMNYRDGMYANCLLANFDSNKKLLFVKKGDQIVGRAIIRLSKTTEKLKSTDTALHFVDVEEETLVNEKVEKSKERLVIFLERYYTAHLSSDEIKRMTKLFVDMAIAKANEIGATFIASHDYGDCGLVSKTCNVFVSHTKNGVQYMDSFGGSLQAENEGGYKTYKFYVQPS